MPGNPTVHQSFSTLPKREGPFVELDSGYITLPWYMFLLQLWRAAGQSMSNVVQSVFFQQAPAGGSPISVFDSSSGALLGELNLSPITPGKPEQQILGASPFRFVAKKQGTLIVSSGQISLSRDNGVSLYLIGLVGGAIPVLPADVVLVAWFAGPPQVTFFPST